MVAQLYEYTKNLWIVHFKRVNFTVRILNFFFKKEKLEQIFFWNQQKVRELKSEKRRAKGTHPKQPYFPSE